ncbi:hypothetical protein [Devosia sp.]|uniref:hypothetical protein n=1 Tax=Devosia sp. TaxID=1871048 RepID=UPI003267D6DE
MVLLIIVSRSVAIKYTTRLTIAPKNTTQIALLQAENIADLCGLFPATDIHSILLKRAAPPRNRLRVNTFSL